MTTDEQEAESLKYSEQVLMLIRLSSGRVALLGANRRLYRICDCWDEAEIYEAEVIAAVAAAQPPARHSETVLDVGEIEI